jgi:outer membrane protein TolC
MKRLFVILALLLAPRPAVAGQPLLVDEVLASSARHSPAIIEAMARVRSADGRQLSAAGAFDLLFEGDAMVRPLGYYDGSTLEARVTRPLTGNGGALYGGYRVSGGDFAVYDGKNYTNRLGELKLGAVFSLMRDRFTDERRVRLGIAAADAELARLDRQMVAIGVQRRAIEAYQQWAAAGLRVRLYRDLLKLATERQASIERQIRLGARPGILGTENSQNMIRRKALLVRAEQDLAVAATALSFYFRDENGEPRVPPADRLPGTLPAFEVSEPDLLLEGGLARPDLDAILLRLSQAEARGRLAENDVAPRLDLRLEISKDIGAEGAGGATRTPAEGFLGLRFAMPLERRQARGRVAEAAAEADALSARRRLIEDQIRVEVQGLAIQVRSTDQLVALAHDETRLAEEMAEAERRRFFLGASDFIVVNLREELAADARLRQIDAEYRRASARAEIIAATADRRQLGL